MTKQEIEELVDDLVAAINGVIEQRIAKDLAPRIELALADLRAIRKNTAAPPRRPGRPQKRPLKHG